MSYRFDFPRNIQIQTQNLCNYACGMCPYPQQQGRKLRQMSEQLFQRLLAEVAREQTGVRLCLMLQNEPLLDRRFVEWLRLAHENPYVELIHTVSNGSRLDAELLDELVAFPRFGLTISVNAIERRKYLQIHGRDRYEDVRAVLERWPGARSRITLSCVVNDTSWEDARAFRAHWRGRGYAVRLLPMTTRAGNTAGTPLHEVDPDFKYCSFPIDTLAVRWDGKVLLCSEDWEHRETYGDLLTSSIREIWNCPARSALRQAALDGTLGQREPCKSCDAPIASVQRVQLERRLEGQALGTSTPRGATHPHATLIEGKDGLAALGAVSAIDPASGTVAVLCHALPPLEGGGVQLRLPIGYGSELSFTRPEEVWCRARVEAAEPQGADALRVRLKLDASDPAFGFLAWYAADWRATGATPKPPQGGVAAAQPAAIEFGARRQ